MTTSKSLMESISRIDEGATHYSWFKENPEISGDDVSPECCDETPVRPTSDPATVDKENVEKMLKPLDIEGELKASGMDSRLCQFMTKPWDTINKVC
ncbi:hypothetical protein [Vibrio phage Va2]|nr:hypothetical protein [Vibrio phage Va2]